MKRPLAALHTPSRQILLALVAPNSVYALIGIILIALPAFESAYLNSMVTKVLIYGIFALSLNLLFGYAGLFSLGHAAFFGAGAYTAAILTVKYGIGNFWVIMATGLLTAAIFAVLFGFIALRVSGIYFLLVTLAIGQLLYSVALKWRTMTGGSNGIAGISYSNISITWFTMNSTSYYYMVFLLFVICHFLLYRVAKSPFGQALQGIREDERRMQCLGYNIWLYKYITFVVGGLFAGVAGVLLAFQSGVVVPDYLGVLTSATVMLMVILGSDRVFWGPIFGAALIVLLQHILSLYAPARWPLILGGVFVLSVMFLRGGVSLHLVEFSRKIKNLYGST